MADNHVHYKEEKRTKKQTTKIKNGIFCTHSCSFFQNEEEEKKNTIIEPNLTYNRILPAAFLPLVLSNFF